MKVSSAKTVYNAHPLRLCIAQPNACSPSETFLQSHADHLPGNVLVVQGGMIGDRYVRSRAIPVRAVRKLIRIVRGQGFDAEVTACYSKVFRRFKPHVVLAEYGETGVDVMEACVKSRVPLVVHFHGYDASRHDCLERMRLPYRRMFDVAVAIIAVSRAMRETLVELGAPAEKVHWNPCGVDCNAFGGADPAHAPPVFIAVGRFTEKKAPQLTLLAFAQVHRTNPQARLRMVGGGPLLDSCRDLAYGLGIADAVTFLGVCRPSTIQQEMRDARCFVQHSLRAPNGDAEGTPVAILEASASGLPIVSTRHAGIPDVVIDGATGFLGDERDVSAMAEKMRLLADQPASAGAMGHAGRQTIIERFSMENSIQGLWRVIERCINGEQRTATLSAGSATAVPFVNVLTTTPDA